MLNYFIILILLASEVASFVETNYLPSEVFAPYSAFGPCINATFVSFSFKRSEAEVSNGKWSIQIVAYRLIF